MCPFARNRLAGRKASLPTGPRHGSDTPIRRQTAAEWEISGGTTILSAADVNSILIGLSAALGALVIILAILFAVSARRRNRSAEARVADVVETLERRMVELATELAGAVERAEEEGRRSRFLGEIAGSIDLDEVVARTLEAAAG